MPRAEAKGTSSALTASSASVTSRAKSCSGTWPSAACEHDVSTPGRCPPGAEAERHLSGATAPAGGSSPAQPPAPGRAEGQAVANVASLTTLHKDRKGCRASRRGLLPACSEGRGGRWTGRGSQQSGCAKTRAGGRGSAVQFAQVLPPPPRRQEARGADTAAPWLSSGGWCSEFSPLRAGKTPSSETAKSEDDTPGDPQLRTHSAFFRRRQNPGPLLTTSPYTTGNQQTRDLENESRWRRFCLVFIYLRHLRQKLRRG